MRRPYRVSPGGATTSCGTVFDYPTLAECYKVAALDAVHQLVVNDTYVAVAVGRDHRDAAPQRISRRRPGHAA